MRYLIVVIQVDINDEFERVLHMYLTTNPDQILIYKRKVLDHYPKGSVKILTFNEPALIEKLGLEWDYD